MQFVQVRLLFDVVNLHIYIMMCNAHLHGPVVHMNWCTSRIHPLFRCSTAGIIRQVGIFFCGVPGGAVAGSAANQNN